MQFFSTLALAAAFGAGVVLAHGEVESISVSQFQEDFASAQIVPEVLPAFNPSVSFYAGYASSDGDDGLLMPGMNLTLAEAGAPVEFSVENLSNATNATSSSKYIICMIGPDVPSRSDPTSRNVRHYLAGNFTVSGDNSSILPTAAKLTNTSAAFNEYNEPKPTNGTGAHRYVYLLYVQPSRLDNASFESVGLDASDRMNFNLSTFRSQASLGPAVGGTYFIINTDGENSASEQSKGNTASSSRVPTTLALVPLIGVAAFALCL